MENRLTIERPEFTLFPVINNSVFCVLSDPCAVHPGFTRMPHTTRVCCVWWNRSIVGSLAGHQLWGIVYYYYLLIDSNFELFSLVSLVFLSCFLGLPVSTCRSRASGCTLARNVATSTLSTSKASVCRVTSSTGTKPSNCKLLLFLFPQFLCVSVQLLPSTTAVVVFVVCRRPSGEKKPIITQAPTSISLLLLSPSELSAAII